jgi:hypothetical protein
MRQEEAKRLGYALAGGDTTGKGKRAGIYHTVLYCTAVRRYLDPQDDNAVDLLDNR